MYSVYMSLPPTFISMNPLYGVNGTTITIVGENMTNDVTVSMNGTTIPLTNRTSGNISFVAPSGTGSITVMVSDVNSIGLFIYTYQDSQGIVNYSFQTPSIYNDGYYHYINTYYKSSISQLTQFKVEMDVQSVYGIAGFNYLLYSDISFTQLYGVCQSTAFVSGKKYLFQLPSSLTLYAIARISLLPGSALTLSSFKLNGVEQITSGTFTYSLPHVKWLTTNSNTYCYRSLLLGQITDPTMNVVLTVQSVTGNVWFQFVHFSDSMYINTQWSSPITSLSVGDKTATIDTVGISYVVARITMTPGCSVTLSSFKLNGIEQLKHNLSWTIDASLPATSNNVYPLGTLVNTDSGLITIENLDPSIHTLQGKSIVSVNLDQLTSSGNTLFCTDNPSALTSSRYLIWL